MAGICKECIVTLFRSEPRQCPHRFNTKDGMYLDVIRIVASNMVRMLLI